MFELPQELLPGLFGIYLGTVLILPSMGGNKLKLDYNTYLDVKD